MFINRYLSKTLRPARVIMPKKLFSDDELLSNKLLKNTDNPLFQLSYYSDKNKIKFNHFAEIPNTYIASELLPNLDGFEIKELSNEKIYFETDGTIPLRWIYMIKDFYCNEIEIENKHNINFEPFLRNLSKQSIDELLYKSIKQSLYASFSFKVINNEKEQYWITDKFSFSPYSYKKLSQCNNFLSLKSLNQPYVPTLSKGGGIEIYTEEQLAYSEFIHSVFMKKLYFNKIKGHNYYSNNIGVNKEEVICLFLALKSLGLNVKPYYHLIF